MMLDNYKVPNKDLRVNVSMRFEAETLGAQTSGTDTAHKGIKPKTVNVSLLIPFTDAEQLTQLTAIAEAVRDDGSLHIYDITEETANAMKVRQVQFSETFDVREDYEWNAWQVNFSLQEYKSVPEKTEQRQDKVTAVVQQANGQTVSEGNEAEPANSMSTMEKIIAKMDGMLAPTPSAPDEAA